MKRTYYTFEVEILGEVHEIVAAIWANEGYGGIDLARSMMKQKAREIWEAQLPKFSYVEHSWNKEVKEEEYPTSRRPKCHICGNRHPYYRECYTGKYI